jgi:hypothetical protein
MEPDVADARWCSPRSLCVQPPFQLTSVVWRPQMGVADSRGECCRLLGLTVALSAGFHFRLLCSWNSWMDGGAAIVVLAVSPLAALSLRTAVKSCGTSVYTPYSCFPFRNWWRFLLVSTTFWMIRVRFGLWPTDTGVHPTRWAVVMRTLRTHNNGVRYSIRFDQSFWNSGVGTWYKLPLLLLLQSIIYRNHTKHSSLILAD